MTCNKKHFIKDQSISTQCWQWKNTYSTERV